MLIIHRTENCKFSGVRYLFYLAAFLGCMINMIMRVVINVSIVAMVNNTAVYNIQNNSVSLECSDNVVTSSNSSFTNQPSKDGEFNWSPKAQGHVLGAFYYGYFVMQIFGGRLSEIYSAKWVAGIGTISTAILSLLTPIAARFHIVALIVLRILEGIVQGVFFPSIYSMCSRWVPDTQLNWAASFIYCGLNIGAAAGISMTGVVSSSDWLGGWPVSFYIAGIIGVTWFFLWSIFITDSPKSHPFITNDEKDYIVSNQRIDQNAQLPPFPWRKVFTSLPVYAQIINHAGLEWSSYLLLTDLPTFFATILHFDVEKNGYFSSLPYLLICGVVLIVGYFSDKLVVKKIVTVSFIRKFSASIAGFVSALLLVGVCLAGCNTTLSIVFLILSAVVNCFVCYSCMLSPIDMSPEYAGTLMGISNAISSLTGFLTPLVVGHITDEKQTLGQWYIVFAITIVILLFSTFIYVFFSTTEKQDWSTPEPENDRSTDLAPHQSKQENYGSLH